jgi:hypothetical protein
MSGTVGTMNRISTRSRPDGCMGMGLIPLYRWAVPGERQWKVNSTFDGLVGAVAATALRDGPVARRLQCGGFL